MPDINGILKAFSPWDVQIIDFITNFTLEKPYKKACIWQLIYWCFSADVPNSILCIYKHQVYSSHEINSIPSKFCAMM